MEVEPRQAENAFGKRFMKFPRTVASLLLLIGLVAGGLLTGLGFALGRTFQPTPAPFMTPTPAPAPPAPQLAAQQNGKWPVLSPPANVNFGGWLCLEDWFYSGSFGTDVATSNNKGQGACFPPTVQGPLPEPWPSEGILVHRMVEAVGSDQTIENFRLHRQSFISTKDLNDVQTLGVQIVRVPLTWFAFADALSTVDKDIYGSFDPEVESVIVPDPFYHENASYVTIPRQFLAQFLRNCSARGLKALLDVHAFPSGSSLGTYNGIYPLKPVFWSNHSRLGNTSVALTEAGHWIVAKLIDWVESLDAEAREAVGGITVMNEPGHNLAGTLDSRKILNWIAQAADMFRRSHLPSRGVKLYVNLIGSAINNFDEVVAPWWEATFSDAERNLWAVMDIHNYLAWVDQCEGHPAGIAGGGYQCDDPIEDVQKVLKRCLEPFVKNFAKRYEGLRSCSEFSLSTAAFAPQACNNSEVLRVFLDQQVHLFRTYGIEPFFWTFKMPYGPNFEAGWSYQYHVGLAESPPFQCLPPQNSTRTAIF